MSTPEKLLGGHATGTLTEAEKARLYRAALEDQALFDALMDEEALRELLEDPDAKARLMEALAPRRVLPLHRRPWVLGAAASLLLGLATTWNVLRTRPIPSAVRPAGAAQPAPAAPETESTQPSSTASRPRLQESPPSPTIPPPASVQNAIPDRDSLAVGEDRSAPAFKKVEGVPAQEDHVAAQAAPALQSLASAGGDAKAERADHRAKALAAAPAGVPRGAMEVVVDVPPPLWRLEDAGLGRTRLHLTLIRPGTVYLLRRDGDQVTLAPGEGTGLARTYLLQPTPGARWDLYVLPGPVGQPTRLPESGPEVGWHQRIVIPAR